MPANLTPQYHKAEEVYKSAKTTEEKIAALEEMLAVMPKHKGTDHLQADLRRRISKLREDASKPSKGKKAFDPFRIEKYGAGQVPLLGAPNSGKSAIVHRLSNAPTAPTPFPFATQGPVPGMMAFEDVQIQIVDLPPITADFLPKGMLGLAKASDGLILVADLASESVLEDLDAILAKLEEARIVPFDAKVPGYEVPSVEESEEADAAASLGEEEASDEETPSFLIRRLPTLLVANKLDAPGAADRLAILGEVQAGRFVVHPVSVDRGDGVEELPSKVFRMLDRIRVYSKEPGKPVDRSSPFVLRRGQTILDLAGRIHRDFPDHLRQARVWGSARFDGQAVGKDHVLVDRDVVELQVDL